MARDWQHDLVARGIAVRPIRIKYARGARIFWAPVRYIKIGAATMGAPVWTLRALAERTGYTLSGLRKALARLASWGAIGIRSSRGQHGRTRITWARDVDVPDVNVSPTVRTPVGSREKTVTVSGHIHPEATADGPKGAPTPAWFAARMAELFGTDR